VKCRLPDSGHEHLLLRAHLAGDGDGSDLPGLLDCQAVKEGVSDPTDVANGPMDTVAKDESAARHELEDVMA